MGPMADLHFLANPARFRRFSQRVLPGLGLATALMLAIGFYLAFFVAPQDYQQGNTVRIMYVHVPSAWMSMAIYTMHGDRLGASLLVWRHALADADAARPRPRSGRASRLVCLVTGSLWGKPMWGTWWVWDARLTSMLMLFFLYLGHIACGRRADDEAKRGARAGHPGAGRRHQRADHQVLGRLVEHAAPAGLDHPARRAGDPQFDPGAAALDGGVAAAAVRLAGAAAHRDRDRPPSSRECRGRGMSGHAVYILASWLVTAVILGGLVIASLGARRKVRRELAARGLEKRR
jgi:heme exporter protein CcmD